MFLSRTAAILGLAGALCSCSTIGEILDPSSPAIERGRFVAEARCAGCHSVGLRGDSPKPPARPFRIIAGSYSDTGLARELEAVGEVGHYEMPPTPIEPADAVALAAYIHSLAGR